MTKRTAINSLLLSPMLCSIVRACPMCRDSVAVAPAAGGNPPVAVFNASVLAILGAFLVVTGLLVVKIVRAIRTLDR